jgi:hypothetical protein
MGVGDMDEITANILNTLNEKIALKEDSTNI